MSGQKKLVVSIVDAHPVQPNCEMTGCDKTATRVVSEKDLFGGDRLVAFICGNLNHLTTIEQAIPGGCEFVINSSRITATRLPEGSNLN